MNSKIDFNNSDNIDNLPDNLLDALKVIEEEGHLNTQDLNVLSQTQHSKMNRFFQPKLNVMRAKELLRAIIDDDKNKVRRILDIIPEIVLEDMAQIPSVESRLTGQAFIPESIIKMVFKRQQIEMLKVILPYYEALESKGIIDDAKQIVLNQIQEAKIEMGSQPQFNFEALIDLIDQIDGISIIMPAISKIIGEDEQIDLDTWGNDELNNAILSFRKTMLPTQPISLNDSFNFEKLLLQALEIQDNFKNDAINGIGLSAFENGVAKHIYFNTKVQGFIASLINPELAKVISTDISKVLNNNQPVDDSSLNPIYKLTNKPYYPDRIDGNGIGYTKGLLLIRGEEINQYLYLRETAFANVITQLQKNQWPQFNEVHEEANAESGSSLCIIL